MFLLSKPAFLHKESIISFFILDPPIIINRNFLLTCSVRSSRTGLVVNCSFFNSAISASNLKKAMTKILLEKGYILSYKFEDDNKQGKIKVALKYHPKTKIPAIKKIRRISKPGLRKYANTNELPRVLNGLGIAVLSTSKGVITDKELDSWLDELESNHVVVILDSCYSGRMFSICEKDRVVLTAGGRFLLCPVSESDELKSGIFTYFLLEGFNGSADKNNDGWISAEEVFHYARMPTFKFSFWKQFPFVRFNPYFYVIPPQLPYIYDECPGEVDLIKYN